MFDDQQDTTQLRLTLQEARSKAQILRTELYRLRREPLPPAQPEDFMQPGENDGCASIQEALDLAQRTIQVYEAELHRMRTTRSSQENSGNRPVTTEQQRGCLLTGWLTVIGIWSVVYFILLLLSGGLSIFGFILRLIALILSLIGITGIGNLQRWGYYLMIGLFTFYIIMDFILVGTFEAVFLGAFGIAISLLNIIVLTALVLPRWKYLE